MLLTILSVIVLLVIINILLLTFSCNKVSSRVSAKAIEPSNKVKKIPTKESQTVYYAATGS